MFRSFESQVLPHLAECVAEENREELREQAKLSQKKEKEEIEQKRKADEKRKQKAMEIKKEAEEALKVAGQHAREAVLASNEKKCDEMCEEFMREGHPKIGFNVKEAMNNIEENKKSRHTELLNQFERIETQSYTKEKHELALKVMSTKTIDEVESLLFEDTPPFSSTTFQDATKKTINDSLSFFPMREQQSISALKDFSSSLSALARKPVTMKKEHQEKLPKGFVKECCIIVAESRESTAYVANDWVERISAALVSFQADLEDQKKMMEDGHEELKKCLDKAGNDPVTLKETLAVWSKNYETNCSESMEKKEAISKKQQQKNYEEYQAETVAGLHSFNSAMKSLSIGSRGAHNNKGIEKKLQDLESREMRVKKLSAVIEEKEVHAKEEGTRSLVHVHPKTSEIDSKVNLHIVLDEDFNSWTKAKEEAFLSNIRSITGLNLTIKNVRAGSVVITAEALHAAVNDELRDRLTSDQTRKALSERIHCRLLLVGNYGLDLNAAGNILNPKFNKVYSSRSLSQREIREEAGEGAQVAYWTGALQDRHDRGNHPYYCPEGWTRFSINVGTREEFDARYSGWHIAYHGTKQGAVGPILLSTLRQGPRAAQGRAIYLTPSIIYASNENYASPWTLDDGTRVQVVLQCRVRPAAITARRGATVGHQTNGPIDRNFSDEELHWLVRPNGNDGHAGPDQAVCYGILIRKW